MPVVSHLNNFPSLYEHQNGGRGFTWGTEVIISMSNCSKEKIRLLYHNWVSLLIGISKRLNTLSQKCSFYKRHDIFKALATGKFWQHVIPAALKIAMSPKQKCYIRALKEKWQEAFIEQQASIKTALSLHQQHKS